MNRALLPPLLAAALSFACGRSSHPAPAPRDAFPDRAQGFGAKLVVDAGGGRHLAAGTPVGTGPRPVRYGYCAAGCGAASSWAFVSLDELGAAGGSVDLAVDGAGHPRLVWYSRDASVAEYRYAFCDAGCTDAAGWTVVLLWPATVAGPLALTRYLALASDGRPRLVWADANPNHAGVFYSFCDGDCAQSLGGPSSGWHEVLLPTSSASADFTVAVAASGATRVGARTAGDDLAWLQCETGCDAREGWSNETSLFALGIGGSFALSLDGEGNPRLALYQDTSAGGVPGPSDQRLFYASCDGDCAGRDA